MGPNSRLKLGALSATLAILLVSVPIHNDIEYALKSETKSAETSSGNSLIDAPTWRINDRWVYSGELDVYDFIVDSGVSTNVNTCLLYTSPSPRDIRRSRMPSSA